MRFVFLLESYPAPVIENLLNLHCDSLERIELPPIPGKGLPNLSAFQKLSELHLHASSFFNTAPFDASSKLVTPCLQRLTIDFTKHEQFSRSVGGSVDPEDFSNHKAKFLEHFIITQKSGQSKTSLRQIFLRFGPDTIAKDSILLELWSADLVEEVSAVAASYDISLTYNKLVYVEGRGEFPRRVLDRTQHMIFDLLLEPPTQDGVHVDAIKNSLELPLQRLSLLLRGCWGMVYFLLLLMLIHSISLTIFREHISYYSWKPAGWTEYILDEIYNSSSHPSCSKYGRERRGLAEGRQRVQGWPRREHRRTIRFAMHHGISKHHLLLAWP
ncbi:uncharacterized protein ASPGLDRAFT_976101 [Aspergillus glaucus CBS 516.65]|uniref:Uncharacterized protein n=1 Tax=Aspergillus glaucus CBS 516.65 TaxID=1160497 RepID=A0A1L9VUT6_ASPGL|nr:hypothetical protein ASPGLDRAFT_976101 [Aspergillus glaucus CBS 516.65]OJJ87637.1 hypothetical protein ASPGLDRAFT_976101 [Aspergillus glaucus CBS 516.65]